MMDIKVMRALKKRKRKRKINSKKGKERERERGRESNSMIFNVSQRLPPIRYTKLLHQTGSQIASSPYCFCIFAIVSDI